MIKAVPVSLNKTTPYKTTDGPMNINLHTPWWNEHFLIRNSQSKIWTWTVPDSLPFQILVNRSVHSKFRVGMRSPLAVRCPFWSWIKGYAFGVFVLLTDCSINNFNYFMCVSQRIDFLLMVSQFLVLTNVRRIIKFCWFAWTLTN